MIKHTRRHVFSSQWQANALARGFLGIVLTVLLFVFAFSLVFGLLTILSNNEGKLDLSQVTVYIHGGYSALSDLPHRELIIVVLVSGVFVLITAIAFWRIYRTGYEIKEEPVETLPDDNDKRNHQWVGFHSEHAGKDKEDAGNMRLELDWYMDEFFLNSLIYPRSVFSRISEHISPGRRMLDCSVNYELTVPSQHGMQVVGLNDLSVKINPEKALPCNLLIPVSFQKRGSLAIKQEVRNTSGVLFPIVKQKDITERILTMIDARLFPSNDRFNAEGKPIDSEISRQWEEERPKLEKYLFNNIKPNDNIDIPLAVGNLLARYASDPDDRNFCRCMTKVLVGLKDVIPTCVYMHAAAIPYSEDYDTPLRIFSLSLQEKREMDVKTSNVFPNRSNNPFIELVNKMIRLTAKRTDTIYYNLARAGRSTSYHLHVEGPEETYYARGSLMRQNPEDTRRIYADHVVMQKRYGQRNAHIYIRSGHRMSNVTFMFRYRKTPLDTYHIMFIATFLCTAVLLVCAMTLCLNDSGDNFLPVATMLLAVVTAAGSWIYNRASDGRDESWGIQISTITMTACAVIGIVLFFFLATKDDRGLSGFTLIAWSILVSIMAVDSAMVGYVALLHSSIYQYLLEKIADDEQTSKQQVHSDTSVIRKETRNGIRLDTPQGRTVRNPYGAWTESLAEFRRRCGINEE